MLGLATKTPIVIDLIIDRTKFITTLIQPKTKEYDPVEDFDVFNAKTTPLQKVVYIEHIVTLKRLLQANKDLSQYKVLIFDSTNNLSAAGIEILDAGRRDTVWEFYKVQPTAINERIISTSTGASLPKEIMEAPDVPKIPKVIKLSDDVLKGQLKMLTESVLENITDADRKERFPKSVVKYSVGLISEDKWKLAKEKAILCGADKKKLGRLQSYIDNYGEGVWQAYNDISLFETPKEMAVIEARSKANDIDWMIEVIPPSKDQKFLIELPTALISKRKRMLSIKEK